MEKTLTKTLCKLSLKIHNIIHMRNKLTHQQTWNSNTFLSQSKKKSLSHFLTLLFYRKVKLWFSSLLLLKSNILTTWSITLFIETVMDRWLKKRLKREEFSKFMVTLIKNLEHPLISILEKKRYIFLFILVRHHDQYWSRFKRSWLPRSQPHCSLWHSTNNHRLW